MLPHNITDSHKLNRRATILVCGIGCGLLLLGGLVLSLPNVSLSTSIFIILSLSFSALALLAFFLVKQLENTPNKSASIDQTQPEKVASLVQHIAKLEARLRKQQVSHVRSEKMTSLAELAAGVVRAIEKPTDAMLSNLCTLKEYVFFLEKLSRQQLTLMSSMSKQEKLIHESLIEDIKKTLEVEDLDYVLSDANALTDASLNDGAQLKEITTSMKGYDHETVNEDAISVIEQINQALDIAWFNKDHDCTLEKVLDECPKISMDEGALTQVLVNIIDNARQAMAAEGGILTIKTFTDGDNIAIEITDSGCGISTNNISKVFEPFFSTRSVGKSAGLGLAVSYDIISSYGGSIELNSEEAIGSTFRILLPLSKQSRT